APELVDAIRAAGLNDEQVTQTEHVEWLRGVYDSLVSSRAAPAILPESAELTLEDCGVFLNHRYWIEDASTAAHTQRAMPDGEGPLLTKAYRYLQNHGVRATMRRIAAEARLRLH